MCVAQCVSTVANPIPNPVVPRSSEPPPLTELIERLVEDLKSLTRHEVQLAKHEIGERLSHVQQYAVALGIGVAALAAGLLVLLAAGVLALALVMPAWAAALLVGGVMSAVGVALCLSSKAKLSQLSIKPEHTLESVQKDVAAIKGAVT